MSMHPENLGAKRRDVIMDRISTLPDVILFHILSFLPTLDAVTTTAVSQRFSNLWYYITSLHFSYHAPTPSSIEAGFSDANVDLMCFINFVNRVLLVLRTRCMDKISFDFSGLHLFRDEMLIENLENWVAAAEFRKVKIFELLNFDGKLLLILPNCLFSCNSLEILYLSHCVVLLNKSSLVCLPNLQMLRLDNVGFVGTEYVDKFLSGCSSLHTLYMRRRKGDNLDRVSVCSPTLQHLTIVSTSMTDFSSRGSDEEEDKSHSKLTIDTPALKYLYLKQDMFKYFSIKTSTQLVEAEISLCTALCELGTAEHLIEALSAVRLLSLDVSDTWLEYHHHSLVWPMFPNLTSLTLMNFYEQFPILKDLLQNSPALETLVLDCTTLSKVSMGEPNVIPGHISPFLEMVKIDCFCGTPDQLKVVEYILLNAGSLKTMTITTAFKELATRLEHLQEISKFRRKSKDCIIEYQ